VDNFVLPRAARDIRAVPLVGSAAWAMDPDRPRYLGRVGGYVETSAAAVDRLECVDVDTQRRLSQRARLDELRRTREAWASTEAVVEGAVGVFAEVADPRLRPGLRGLEKAVRRLGHMVDRLEPLDDE
jgi:hypothetical protein